MKRTKLLLLTSALLTLTACASGKKPVSYEWNESSDPFEGINRSINSFNNTADKYILRPVAKGYSSAVPKPAKRGVSNFFSNLGEPLNVVNNVLQGKFDRALGSTYRFTVNSTIGLLGLFDVAKHQGVNKTPEDLGQTLASWGVKPGPYLVVPFLGPTTLRDGFGRAVSSAAYYPINQVSDSASTRLGLNVLSIVDARSKFLGVDESLDKQLDPYLFIKNTLDASRTDAINDGETPEPEFEFDF